MNRSLETASDNARYGLSKGYRAFYKIEGTTAKLVRVIEINKHEY